MADRLADMLFAYGALSDPHLLDAVLARPPGAAPPLAAHAPGFAARLVHATGDAALARTPGAIVEGLLLRHLSAFERDLLAAWYGAGYRAASLPVLVDEELHLALAFMSIATPGHEAPAWSLAPWQRDRKPRDLPAASDRAGRLRLKLIAARGH